MTVKLSYKAVLGVIFFMLFIAASGMFSAEDSNATIIMLKSDNGNVYMGDDGKYYISSSQRVYLEAIDRSMSGRGVGVGRIDVKVDDGEFVHYFKSRTDKIFLGKSGEHLISYRVADRLGNVSDDMSVSIIVDDTRPTAILEYKLTDSTKKHFMKDNFVYLPGENVITVTATDTISGLKTLMISKDSKDYESVVSGTSFTLDKRGINLIRLKSLDNVMNESSVSIHSFYVDNAPPTIEIKTKYALVDGEDSPPESSSGKKEDVSDMDDSMMLDDPMDKPVDSDKSRGKSEKSDGVERALPVEEVGYSLERNLLPGSSEEPRYKYTNTKNVFHFIVNDNDSGLSKVEWRLNGGEWTAYDNDPVQLSGAGVNTIEIKAIDLVGNIASKSLSIIVDDLAPEVKLKISSEEEE